MICGGVMHECKKSYQNSQSTGDHRSIMKTNQKQQLEVRRIITKSKMNQTRSQKFSKLELEEETLEIEPK